MFVFYFFLTLAFASEGPDANKRPVKAGPNAECVECPQQEVRASTVAFTNLAEVEQAINGLRNRLSSGPKRATQKEVDELTERVDELEGRIDELEEQFGERITLVEDRLTEVERGLAELRELIPRVEELERWRDEEAQPALDQIPALQGRRTYGFVGVMGDARLGAPLPPLHGPTFFVGNLVGGVGSQGQSMDVFGRARLGVGVSNTFTAGGDVAIMPFAFRAFALGFSLGGTYEGVRSIGHSQPGANRAQVEIGLPIRLQGLSDDGTVGGRVVLQPYLGVGQTALHSQAFTHVNGGLRLELSALFTAR